MSAVRNALQTAVLLSVILVIASVVLRSQIASQIRADIDDNLVHEAVGIALEMDSFDGTPLQFSDSIADNFLGSSESFRGSDGSILGPVRAEVFDDPGFQTLTELELFSDRYFKLIRQEFFAEEPEATLNEFEEQAAELTEGSLWRVYVARFGEGQIAVYVTIDEVEDALELIPGIILWVGVVIIAAIILSGVGFGFLQQRRMTRINEALAQIARGNLEHRIAPVKIRDDLDGLMLGIDSTAEKLALSTAQLQDFSRNIAHELRTPLTRLRARLETSTGSGDVEHALTQADDLIRIFDAFQNISRLSRKSNSDELASVNLADIAKTMDDLYAEVVAENEQTFHLVIENAAMIQGDRQLLAQLASNLLENAMRYAGPGAQITLGVHGKTLSVADTGPGIPVDERERVFEPLYKIKKGISTGTGLGLAIVKAIIEFHHGTVSLSQPDGGGLVVSVNFAIESDVSTKP